jgi:hypothetical protein
VRLLLVLETLVEVGVLVRRTRARRRGNGLTLALSSENADLFTAPSHLPGRLADINKEEAVRVKYPRTASVVFIAVE